ncbi:MAG: hypothetical protein ABI723_21530 [Bacteroidia bacterium]
MQIAEKFFDPNGFPDVGNYLCCELNFEMDTSKFWYLQKDIDLHDYVPDYRKQTLGQAFRKKAKKTYQQFYLNPDTTLISVELTDKDFGTDLYLYFEYKNGWKLSYIVSLALTNVMLSKFAHQTDAKTIEYFNQNSNEFDTLLMEAQKNIEAESTKKKAKDLGVLVVEKGDDWENDCYRFILDGVTDNEIGFLFIDDESKKPKVDGDYYIILKPIKKG